MGLLIALVSCTDSMPECIDAEYGNDFEFKLDDEICLQDGTMILVAGIDDARCPCNVECIWEGEFIFELEISNGTVEETFLLNEKSEMESPVNFSLDFLDVRLISEDSCADPVDIEDMVFAMRITNS